MIILVGDMVISLRIILDYFIYFKNDVSYLINVLSISIFIAIENGRMGWG